MANRFGPSPLTRGTSTSGAQVRCRKATLGGDQAGLVRVQDASQNHRVSNRLDEICGAG